MTACGAFTMVCSMRSRFKVEVISWLTVTSVSKISTLRSAINRLALCSAVDAVSVMLERAKRSSSSNGVPSSLFTASTTPTSEPRSMIGVTMSEDTPPSAFEALRMPRRESSEPLIKTASPLSETSPGIPAPGFCTLPAGVVGSNPA